MADFVVGRNEAIAFLSSFGEHTEDLLVFVAGARLTGTVGFDTFYFRKQIVIPPNQISKEGEIGLSDLKKVIQFCKKSKADGVRFFQQELGKQLTVKCGGMTLKVPTMKVMNSHAKVPAIEKMIMKTEENMFTHYKETQLEGHGIIDVSQLRAVSGFKNFFTYPNFLISLHPEEGEFFIKAGKRGTMQLTIDTVLLDAEGPNKRIEGKFGKWLMECSGLLDEGTAWVHMGENTFLFLTQEDNVLVVKNEA